MYEYKLQSLTPHRRFLNSVVGRVQLRVRLHRISRRSFRMSRRANLWAIFARRRRCWGVSSLLAEIFLSLFLYSPSTTPRTSWRCLMISAISIASRESRLRFSSRYHVRAFAVYPVNECWLAEIRSARREGDRLGSASAVTFQCPHRYCHGLAFPTQFLLPESRDAWLLVLSAATRPPSRGTCPNQFRAAHSTRPDARLAHNHRFIKFLLSDIDISLSLQRLTVFCPPLTSEQCAYRKWGFFHLNFPQERQIVFMCVTTLPRGSRVPQLLINSVLLLSPIHYEYVQHDASDFGEYFCSI